MSAAMIGLTSIAISIVGFHAYLVNNAKKLKAFLKENYDLSKSILVKGGGLEAMVWRIMPSFGTHAIASGWDDEKVERLKACIQKVAELNPILTGKLYFLNGELRIVPGLYPPSKHLFYKEYDMPESLKDKDLGSMTALQLLRVMQDEILPCLPQRISHVVNYEMRKEIPLFQVYLMRLPNNCLFYFIVISHAIGDASTYSFITRSLSQLMEQSDSKNKNKQVDVTTISWANNCGSEKDCALKGVASKRDHYRMYGLPTIVHGLGQLIGFLLTPSEKRHQSFLILSREKINKKKQELLDKERNPYLTSNDIIMAAMCDATTNHRVVSMVVSMRSKTFRYPEFDDEKKKWVTIPKNAGGTLLRRVPFLRTKGCDPNMIHLYARQNKPAFEPDTVPTYALMTTAFAVSNWSSVTKPLVVEGTTRLAEMVHPSYIKNAVGPRSAVFDLDENHIGVTYNTESLDRSRPFLQDIMASQMS